jgi:hypothetical protein
MRVDRKEKMEGLKKALPDAHFIKQLGLVLPGYVWPQQPNRRIRDAYVR